MVYLVLDRRITVGNGVFGTENDVSVITLCFHSKMLGLLMHLWWIHTGFLAGSDIIQYYIFSKKVNFYVLERKPNSVGIHLKSSAIDVSRGVDIKNAIFFKTDK